MIGSEPSSNNIEMDNQIEQVKVGYDNINMTPYGIMSRFNLWYPKGTLIQQDSDILVTSYEWEKNRPCK